MKNIFSKSKPEFTPEERASVLSKIDSLLGKSTGNIFRTAIPGGLPFDAACRALATRLEKPLWTDAELKELRRLQVEHHRLRLDLDKFCRSAAIKDHQAALSENANNAASGADFSENAPINLDQRMSLYRSRSDTIKTAQRRIATNAFAIIGPGLDRFAVGAKTVIENILLEDFRSYESLGIPYFQTSVLAQALSEILAKFKQRVDSLKESAASGYLCAAPKDIICDLVEL